MKRIIILKWRNIYPRSRGNNLVEKSLNLLLTQLNTYVHRIWHDIFNSADKIRLNFAYPLKEIKGAVFWCSRKGIQFFAESRKRCFAWYPISLDRNLKTTNIYCKYQSLKKCRLLIQHIEFSNEISISSGPVLWNPFT